MNTIGEAAQFLSGGTPKKSDASYWNGDIPWFSASNMSEKFLYDSSLTISDEGLKAGSRIAPSGSTLLLVRGSGLFNHIPICFAERDVAFNQDVKAIVAKQGIDPLYLHYTLEMHRRKLADNLDVTGIGAGKFDTSFIKGLSFVQREYAEQVEIGRLASAYDRRIYLNRQINETLEDMARALFRDWFVDFGPTRRQMEGATDPTVIMGNALPAQKAAELVPLFPTKLGEDGLPKGWSIQYAKAFAEKVQNGGTPNRKNNEYWDGGSIPWLTSGEVRKSFIIGTENFITEAGLSGSSAKWVNRGSTLVALYGATAGQVSLTFNELTTNQAICALIPKPQNRYFLLLSMRSNVANLADSAVGSAQQNISKKIVEEIELPYAGDDLVTHFETLVSPLFEKIEVGLRENQTLAEMRDLLLPKLMSGEIRLKDAEVAI
jgi:type I restriction enzyme S subunit